MTSLPGSNDKFGQKVVWMDNTSDSGLALGSTGIEREGILLGMQLLPGPTPQAAVLFAFIRRLTDDSIVVVDASMLKFKD